MRKFLLCLAMLACLLGLVTSSIGTAQEQQDRISVLVVTGDDVKSHPWRESTQFTRKVLEETSKYDVKIAEDINIFESSRLDQYDVVILNYGYWNLPELSDQGRQNLMNFVENGGGLVSLHFACSSFQDWPQYQDLLGRVWKKGTGGHGPRGKFTVKIEDPDHPITQGLADFDADDELYAKLSGDEEIHVLASAYSDWSGKVEPIVFTTRHGKGNVVQNVLGHDMAARQTPNYTTLLRRSVEWAATGEVTQQ